MNKSEFKSFVSYLGTRSDRRARIFLKTVKIGAELSEEVDFNPRDSRIPNQLIEDYNNQKGAK